MPLEGRAGAIENVGDRGGGHCCPCRSGDGTGRVAVRPADFDIDGGPSSSRISGGLVHVALNRRGALCGVGYA